MKCLVINPEEDAFVKDQVQLNLTGLMKKNLFCNFLLLEQTKTKNIQDQVVNEIPDRRKKTIYTFKIPYIKQTQVLNETLNTTAATSRQRISHVNLGRLSLESHNLKIYRLYDWISKNSK